MRKKSSWKGSGSAKSAIFFTFFRAVATTKDTDRCCRCKRWVARSCGCNYMLCYYPHTAFVTLSVSCVFYIDKHSPHSQLGLSPTTHYFYVRSQSFSPFFQERERERRKMHQVLFVMTAASSHFSFNPVYLQHHTLFQFNQVKIFCFIFCDTREQVFVYCDRNYSFVTPSNQVLCYVITNVSQWILSIDAHIHFDTVSYRQEIQHQVCPAFFYEIACQRLWI